MSEEKKVLFERKTEVIDKKTGEVLTTEKNEIIKVPKTPDFVMLFTQNLGALFSLTKTEIKVLSIILQKYVMRGNAVALDTKIRKKIAEEAGVKSLATLRTILHRLRKKQIFVDIDDITHVNPYIFGKGSWNEIRKLRQEFIWEWDFESCEVKKIVNTISVYEGAENIKDMKIVDAREEIDSVKKEIRRVVEVEEAEEAPSKKSAVYEAKPIERQPAASLEALKKAAKTNKTKVTTTDNQELRKMAFDGIEK